MLRRNCKHCNQVTEKNKIWYCEKLSKEISEIDNCDSNKEVL